MHLITAASLPTVSTSEDGVEPSLRSKQERRHVTGLTIFDRGRVACEHLSFALWAL